MERCEVGGLIANRGRVDLGDDVRPGGCRSGVLVGLGGYAVEAQAEGQRRGGGCDRQQQKDGFGRAPAQVTRREAADEQEAAHGASPRAL
jgi:hypothetical protein